MFIHLDDCHHLPVCNYDSSMPGRTRGWTDATLIRAVAMSHSVAAVLRELGLRVAGGNYEIVKRRIRQLTLDTSHWTGQATWRGKTNPHVPKIPLADLLCRGSTYHSDKLRRRLLSENIFLP